MAFQSEVRLDITSYLVGEIVFSGPLRAEPKILNSTDAANNVFGRAFQQVSGSGNDLEVSADIGSDGVFAGIMVNPKEHVTSGTASGGSLAPTLTLANNESATFLKEGTIAVEVNLTTAVNIGDDIFYNYTDGTLTAQAPGGTAPASHAADKIANVVRCNIAADTDRIVLIHVFG